MIAALVEQWNARQEVLRAKYSTQHPGSYSAILQDLLTLVLTAPVDFRYGSLDASKVVRVDHGDYQGTEIYLIPLSTYQPSAEDYVWFSNEYGSCSGCDAFSAVRDNYGRWDDPPNEKQTEGYMSLALHMVQRMKWLEGT